MKTTAEKALDLIAQEPDCRRCSSGVCTYARMGVPGTISDGTRRLIICVEDTGKRYLTLRLGWEVIFDIDQRNHMGKPTQMARLMLDRLEELKHRHHKPGWRSELTPEGEQLVIPGCEKDAAPGIRQMELF